LALRVAVQALRQEGHIVVQVFPGETATHDEFIFDRELVLQNGHWKMQRVV
jgi:ATP phosphoribosyltransferase regulatory subunit